MKLSKNESEVNGSGNGNGGASGGEETGNGEVHVDDQDDWKVGVTQFRA